MGEAEFLQQLTDIAFVIDNPEALLDDALQIEAPPAHHAVDRRVGAGLHDPRQFRLLLRRQPRLGAAIPGVLQPLRTGIVEAVHPIAQGLPVHAADPGRIRPAHPVQHRRQRQKPAALVDVLRQPSQRGRRIVIPQLHR